MEAIAVAHPEGKAANAKRQVKHTVHVVTRRITAGVIGEGFTHGLVFAVDVNVLFVDRLLDAPDIRAAAHVGGFKRVVRRNIGDKLAENGGKDTVRALVVHLRLVNQRLDKLILPAVALDHLAQARQVKCKLAVCLAVGDRNVIIPKQIQIVVRPMVPTGNKGAVQGGKAHLVRDLKVLFEDR